ncbi:MAG: hypothetical protein ACLGIW_17125, partial [Gammaproteobacteria bacterium]
MTERSTTTDSGTTTASRPSARKTPAAKKTAVRAATASTKPRRATLGDVSGTRQPKKLAKVSVETRISARQEAQFAAVQDILSQSGSSR